MNNRELKRRKKRVERLTDWLERHLSTGRRTKNRRRFKKEMWRHVIAIHIHGKPAR